MKQVPHLKTWSKLLMQRKGYGQAFVIMADIQTRYSGLYKNRPVVNNRFLDNQLKDLILPGLALYEALQEVDDDKEEIFALVV